MIGWKHTKSGGKTVIQNLFFFYFFFKTWWNDTFDCIFCIWPDLSGPSVLLHMNSCSSWALPYPPDPCAVIYCTLLPNCIHSDLLRTGFQILRTWMTITQFEVILFRILIISASLLILIVVWVVLNSVSTFSVALDENPQIHTHKWFTGNNAFVYWMWCGGRKPVPAFFMWCGNEFSLTMSEENVPFFNKTSWHH